MPHVVSQSVVEQRREALRKADAIRIPRSRFKKDLKAGRMDVHNLLMNPPELIETMTLFDFVRATPKHATKKANKVIRKSGISASRPMGTLTEGERERLSMLILRP